MKFELLKFLKKYTFDTFRINRLIISSFLYHNKIKVPKDSFVYSYFISEVDDDYNKLNEFLRLVTKKVVNIDFEVLLELFEFVISPADKIINGAVYTPKNIRTFIIDECFRKYQIESLENIVIGDISCGCGGFLLDAAIKIKNMTGNSFRKIYSENIFGLDIQDYSIERTKIILAIYALTKNEVVTNFEFNLFTGNTLEFDWSKIDRISKNGGFNIIIGNPPYVCSRNIDDDSKKLLPKWDVASTGHPDLYIPFFQIGFETLVSGGILAYITVNSFFKSLNGRGLRNYFNEKSISLRIIDFGGEQIFRSRLTYTCICFLENSNSNAIKYIKTSSNSINNEHNAYSKIYYNSLDHSNGWNLLNQDIINKIEKVGIPLYKLFSIKSGIATLKNDVFIFNVTNEDSAFYYNGKNNPIEKDICKEIINPNKLINENNIDKLKKKIIFPYRYIDSKATIIKEEELRELYPNAFKYLENFKNILNSRDKGKKKYEEWYAYGRKQSLEKYRYKLFFPHITPHIPNYVLNENDDLLFVNGIAAISKFLEDLQILKVIMETQLFWNYIIYTSKHYSSGYYSLSKNYIKSFGIYQFQNKDKKFLLSCTDKKEIDGFIEEKYKLI